MQVYADLRVLTARPDRQAEACVPHRLYGMADGSEAFSVGSWLAAVRTVLGECERTGSLPVLVGGTGLYFSSLTQGIASVPPVPAVIRDETRRLAEIAGSAALHAALQRCDPLTAEGVRPSDTQRILRALEVFRATGRPLAAWQAERQPPLLDMRDCVPLVVAPDRAELARRVEARLHRMAEEGALDEVGALVRRRLDPAFPIMKALGVRPLAAHLRGEAGLAEAVDRAVVDTRRYVKRQFTWLRGRMAGWTWVAPEDAANAAERLLSAAGSARTPPRATAS